MLAVLTPAASNDLVTLDRARLELAIPDADTSNDDWLRELIREASDACAWLCGRDGFGLARIQETVLGRGQGTRRIVLARDLAPTIVSVTQDGVALAPEDYGLRGGILERADGTLWRGGTVVVYDSGFDLPDHAPDGLRRACLGILRLWWFGRRRDPAIRQTVTEGVGATRYDSEAQSWPEWVTRILAPWNAVGV